MFLVIFFVEFFGKLKDIILDPVLVLCTYTYVPALHYGVIAECFYSTVDKHECFNKTDLVSIIEEL